MDGFAVAKILSNGEGSRSHGEIEVKEGCQKKGNQEGGPYLSSAGEYN
jgi:hypothetical protein